MYSLRYTKLRSRDRGFDLETDNRRSWSRSLEIGLGRNTEGVINALVSLGNQT
jgi:hypothetical protein